MIQARAPSMDSAGVKLAREILAQHERQTLSGQQLLILRVVKVVAKAWGIGEVALVEPRRGHEARPANPHPDKRPAVSRARSAAAMLLLEQGLRSRRIAQALELRSHSAVLKAIRRAGRLEAEDWAFQRQMKDAREALAEEVAR